MRVSDANIIAIRQGIAAHIKTLGFQRKSEKFYRLEEDDLLIWVGFDLGEDTLFSDSTGIVSKSLKDMIEASPLGSGGYNEWRPHNAHIEYSSVFMAALVSDDEWENYYGRLRLLGPIRWLLPLKKLWMRQDWFTQCPYTRYSSWYAGDDPEGCAVASLAKWQEVIEPWLEAMHDRKAFASWYEHSPQSAFLVPHRALTWAWAGDMESARAIIQQEYNFEKNWSYQDAYNLLRPKKYGQNLYKNEEELGHSIDDSLREAERNVSMALSLADYLGVNILR